LDALPPSAEPNTSQIQKAMSNTFSQLRLLFGGIAFVSLVAIVGCQPTATPAAKSTTNSSTTTEESSASTSETTTEETEASTLRGKIAIDGSSTVQPISNAIQEQFKKPFPGVAVTVAGDGTGNGFKRFAAKEADITGASRPIKAKELDACRAAKVSFIEIPVAYDGLTFAIHPENTWAETLTVDQLKKIFGSESPAKKWSDLDPKWPNEPLNIFSPGTGSGTYDYTREVLAGEGKLREDMSLNEDDNFLVAGVAGNKYAIGFFGVAYFNENKDKLKAAKIVNPATSEAVMPTIENIATNKYAPFSRPLFIYVNAESLSRVEVQSFVDFYVTNAAETSEKVGYVRLPEVLSKAARDNFDNEVLGTHFVDKEGNGRSGAMTDIFVKDNLVQ
jgi:phosphate transport system substrate-binding protein